MNDCSCNGTLLSWVAGNDVLLLARVYEKVLDAGEVTDLPFDLSACDDISVTATAYKTETLEWAIAQDESNCLAVNIPHTLTVGEWAVEITCKRNGYHVRSFEFTFRIVETNCEAQTTFEVVDGCQSASVRVALQIVPQALVRGMNDYEQWKLVTTSEDKSLQYFLDNVINFQSRADQINAAEAQRVLKENERQEMETNRQEAEMQREANSQAAVNAANNAAAGAERVNASLSGTTLTVTNRSGVSVSVDTKGEPGDDGVGVPSGGTAGQVLAKKSGTDYDTQWVNPPAAGVNSVNGKTGDVTLSASDVGALPDDTVIPDAVTEQTVSGWGFTKNTGTYSKPSGGIPSTDLSSDVQTSLGKADSALQSFTERDPTVPSWAKQQNKPSYSYSEISNTPDLNGFITKSVDDLVNYYLKSDTYTKAEVAALIGAIQQFHYEIYASTSAVTTPANNVLYLIGPTGSGSDKYEEYVYDSTKESPWIKIGDTSIDLSGYYTSSQTDTAISTALADYTTTANLTTLLASKQDSLAIQTAYTSKGSATKVPQITTNSLGQVTEITEVTITQPDVSNYVQKSQTAGLLKNDGSVDTNTYLTQHQDISGKQDTIDATHKLSADLVDDTQATNKFVTANEKQTWNGKQDALTFNTTPSSSNKVATMSDIPSSLPANGGNAATVNNHTVAADVPSGAVFTDTTYSVMGASGSGHAGGLVPDTPSTEGTTKFLREDGMWIEPATGDGIVPSDGIRTETVTSAATMTVNPDVVTVIDGAVGTAAITLQVPNDNLAHVWDILMTTGSSAAITFAMSNSETILYPDGFALGASTAVEISVIGVGTKYYLRYGEFA